MDFGNVMSFLQNLQGQNQQNQQNQFGQTLNQLGTQLDRNYGLAQNAQSIAKQQQDFMNQLALRKLRDEEMSRAMYEGQQATDKWNRDNLARNRSIAADNQNLRSKGIMSFLGPSYQSYY